jgi:hypothetical protein
MATGKSGSAHLLGASWSSRAAGIVRVVVLISELFCYSFVRKAAGDRLGPSPWRVCVIGTFFFALHCMRAPARYITGSSYWVSFLQKLSWIISPPLFLTTVLLAAWYVAAVLSQLAIWLFYSAVIFHLRPQLSSWFYAFPSSWKCAYMNVSCLI